MGKLGDIAMVGLVGGAAYLAYKFLKDPLGLSKLGEGLKNLFAPKIDPDLAEENKDVIEGGSTEPKPWEPEAYTKEEGWWGEDITPAPWASEYTAPSAAMATKPTYGYLVNPEREQPTEPAVFNVKVIDPYAKTEVIPAYVPSPAEIARLLPNEQLTYAMTGTLSPSALARLGVGV